MLKPNVVFFGESVPKSRVEAARRIVDDADALLVAGSSLTVYSGFRFVKGRFESGNRIAIVNRGSTRGDELASIRIDGTTGGVLPRLADALAG